MIGERQEALAEFHRDLLDAISVWLHQYKKLNEVRNKETKFSLVLQSNTETKVTFTLNNMNYVKSSAKILIALLLGQPSYIQKI